MRIVHRGNGPVSVEVDVTVPATDCPLEGVLRIASGTRIQLERIVPISEALGPYVRISTETVGEIRSALRTDPYVERFTEIEAVGETSLVRIEWDLESNALFETVVAADGAVMDAIATDRTWWIRLRFPDHQRLGEWYRRCTDRDVSISVERVHTPDGTGFGSDGPSLTAPQREALVTAWHRGYFEVPREVTLEELGSELGVSDTAVSQRLRRGIAKILVTVVNGGDELPGSTASEPSIDDE
jgi:predicted DNA binding protein